MDRILLGIAAYVGIVWLTSRVLATCSNKKEVTMNLPAKKKKCDWCRAPIASKKKSQIVMIKDGKRELSAIFCPRKPCFEKFMESR